MQSHPIVFETVPQLGRALIRRGGDGSRAILLIHGAGLEPTHPLYADLMVTLDPSATIIAPFTMATHFLSFGSNLRDRRGWANHQPTEILKEVREWVRTLALSYSSLSIIGHSWGGYIATQLGVDTDICLVSPIPDLHSIISTNWPSQEPVGKLGSWIETEPGAPFPFLGANLILEASPEPRIVDLINCRQGRTLVVFGEKEHPKIREWVTEVESTASITVSTLAKQGHFYGCQGSGIAAVFQEWVSWR